MNKQQFEHLKEEYITQILDGMDLKSLCEFASDTMAESLKKKTQKEVIEEIREYEPKLLEV